MPAGYDAVVGAADAAGETRSSASSGRFRPRALLDSKVARAVIDRRAHQPMTSARFTGRSSWNDRAGEHARRPPSGRRFRSTAGSAPGRMQSTKCSISRM